MKKYFLLCVMLVGCLFMTGCFKYGEKDVVKDFTKKVEGTKGYHVTGLLEIFNNEDSYKYDVDVSYEKDDQFRVSLKNKTNNHEQIILKNSEGVYVLTPSLNKSFKFQSEWPYNNSQTYLLQNVMTDIKNDKKRTFKETDDGYVFTTSVNYSSNKSLTKQNVYLDKKLNVKEVHVLNDQDQVMMKMKYDKIDLKATYDDNYFALNENMKTAHIDETTDSVGKIDDVIFPMYLPENTKLSSQDKVSKEDGERVILTFSGDKPFMFVQETASVTDDLLTIPVYGEPLLLTDSVGAVSDSSITWASNGMEYYLVSDVMSQEELLQVAKSVSYMPIGK